RRLCRGGFRKRSRHESQPAPGAGHHTAYTLEVGIRRKRLTHLKCPLYLAGRKPSAVEKARLPGLLIPVVTHVRQTKTLLPQQNRVSDPACIRKLCNTGRC